MSKMLSYIDVRGINDSLSVNNHHLFTKIWYSISLLNGSFTSQIFYWSASSPEKILSKDKAALCKDLKIQKQVNKGDRESNRYHENLGPY